MRSIIIDDSPTDRLGLRTLLRQHPGVEIIGEAADLAGARKLLELPALDVVFLDIELGRENGFDLLDSPQPLPCVVFTTVHRHLGEQAFDADATDYLVKPVSEDRLLRALQRVELCRHQDQVSLARVPVHRSGSQRHLVALASIIAVIAEGNYTRVLCGSQAYPDHRSLREWQALLEHYGFERLDRSTLLRPSQVRTLQPYGKGARVSFYQSEFNPEIGRTAFLRLEFLLAKPPPADADAIGAPQASALPKPSAQTATDGSVSQLG